MLDEIDAIKREALDVHVWRLVRAGRDPLLGSPSLSRWCNGSFDVLYTAFEKDGAIAEIHSLLSLQPVFPSKVCWFSSKLSVTATQTLKLADMAMLSRLGVDTTRYSERSYGRTQDIADAAYFLGFDGLIAPSARWNCLNFVLFTDRIAPDQIQLLEMSDVSVSWEEWRKKARSIG